MAQRITNYFTVIWSFVILFIVFIPGNKIPNHGEWMDIFQVDKIIHIFLFAPFSFSWLLKFHFSENINLRTISLIVLSGLLFAISTEIIQYYFIEGRNGNIADAIADVIGIFTGLIAYQFIRKKLFY